MEVPALNLHTPARRGRSRKRETGPKIPRAAVSPDRARHAAFARRCAGLKINAPTAGLLPVEQLFRAVCGDEADTVAALLDASEREFVREAALLPGGIDDPVFGTWAELDAAQGTHRSFRKGQREGPMTLPCPEFPHSPPRGRGGGGESKTSGESKHSSSYGGSYGEVRSNAWGFVSYGVYASHHATALRSRRRCEGYTRRSATLLHVAAWKGALRVIHLLMARGAAWNVRDALGETPFARARVGSAARVALKKPLPPNGVGVADGGRHARALLLRWTLPPSHVPIARYELHDVRGGGRWQVPARDTFAVVEERPGGGRRGATGNKLEGDLTVVYLLERAGAGSAATKGGGNNSTRGSPRVGGVVPVSPRAGVGELARLLEKLRRMFCTAGSPYFDGEDSVYARKAVTRAAACESKESDGGGPETQTRGRSPRGGGGGGDAYLGPLAAFAHYVFRCRACNEEGIWSEWSAEGPLVRTLAEGRYGFEFETPGEARAFDRQYGAAYTIQRVVRGKAARTQVQEKRLWLEHARRRAEEARHAGATRIQSCMRGYLGRKHCGGFVRERRRFMLQRHASVKINTGARGYLARKRYKEGHYGRVRRRRKKGGRRGKGRKGRGRGRGRGKSKGRSRSRSPRKGRRR